MIRIEIKNLKEVRDMFGRYPAQSVKNINDAVRKSIIAIEGESSKQAPVKTGNLRSSWQQSFGFLSGKLKNTAKYAMAVHEGSRPHIIYPRNKSMLAFSIGGRLVFAKKVNHPGNKPNRFLQRAIDLKSHEINQNFEKALEKTLKEISV